MWVTTNSTGEVLALSWSASHWNCGGSLAGIWYGSEARMPPCALSVTTTFAAPWVYA
jgi:hypothetical protein